jgi:hypothetical protein
LKQKVLDETVLPYRPVPSTYRTSLSLNTDEAVVAGKLRDFFKENVEVFIPLNAQLKDVDLVVLNLKNRKAATIQVKGSRAYEPTATMRNFGDGSAGWFFLNKEAIERNTSDFFIFLIYVIVERIALGRRNFEPHFITIRTDRFNELCKQYKVLHTRYSFYFFIDPNKRVAFDFRDEKAKGRMWLTDFLDDVGLEQVRQSLGIG